MRNILKYLGGLLLLAATACSQTQESDTFVPNGADSKAIHFIQSSIVKEFAQESKEGVIEVQIARSANKGSYTVYLSNKGSHAALFQVPDKVTFADGDYAVTIPVAVDLKQFSVGSNYKTTLAISDREVAVPDQSADISQFSDKVTITASFELEWEPYFRTNGSGEKVRQLATYHYSLYYNGRDAGLEVEKAIGANIFRVNNWASGVSFKFILNKDNTCTVPAQSIGYFNATYNEYVYVADMAVYTSNDAAYASYPCTFDGKDTFTFYLIYYVSGGYFAQGKETLVFESDPITTPVVAIEYKGVETTTTGFRAPRLSFTPNSYTKSYKATVVAGDITADAEQQAIVRQGIIDNKLESVTPLLTLFAADDAVWNVPRGNYTAVALAYDEKNQPATLYTKRFTCDPDNEYPVKVHELEWFASDKYSAYSPYTTLFWKMKASNIATMKYLCMSTAYIDYVLNALHLSLEELTVKNGNQITEEILAEINSDEGRTTVFNALDQGTDYTLALVMTNQFGDTFFVSKRATTFGHFAADFDRTKSLDDFLGAFKATATVSIGSKKSEVNYRMDISRISDNEVNISGASDMRDFSPVLRGYFDKEKGMIILEPQSTGRYGENYTVFGLSNGLSIFWGGNSIAIGYIGNTLYWASSPYSPEQVNRYMFLLFNSPQTTGSTYLREYVGAKEYSGISMVPLKLAPTTTPQSVAKNVDVQTVTLHVGEQQVCHHLAGESVPSDALRKTIHDRSTDDAECYQGKVMRRDLTLHK